VPHEIIGAIVESNKPRKEFISEQRISRLSGPGTVGIYKLAMKSGSDNFRESCILDIIGHLKTKGAAVIIHEPSLMSTTYLECPVVNDLSEFKTVSDVIVANRVDDSMNDVVDKLYCRDIFRRD
jgi:UDPglucose 6-dehydrogenase